MSITKSSKAIMGDELIMSGGKTPDVLLNHSLNGHETRLIGEVRYQRLNKNGKVLFESEPEFNDVVLPGSMTILEKTFGVRSPLNIPNLTSILEINDTVIPTVNDISKELILGFVVGIDGAGYLPGEVKPVKYNRNNVFGLIPFRQTTVELDVVEGAKYLLKKFDNTDSKYKYYLKKFSITPVIRHLYTDGTEVQNNVTELSNPQSIRSFVECICDIEASDIREYFMDADGDLVRSRINSMGLVAGFIHSNGEIANARLTTLLNFRNSELENLENTIRFIYRFYCM